MNTEPLVSVLMPAYNTEKYIGEAIESILDQTYTNFEFIILDDCSNDNTWNIIQKYPNSDSRLRAYRNDKNLNIVKTRNKLFKLANDETKYYAIMDSDDISESDRIEKQVIFLENNIEYGAVGSHILIINQNSEIISKRNYPTEYSQIKKSILIKSPLAQPAVMVRRSVIDEVGPYKIENGYNRARDYDLWIKIFERYKITNLNEYLLKYRISPSQGKRTHLKETILSTIQIQKKWLFRNKFFNLRAFFNIILEYILLLIPQQFIINLFKKMEYKEL